MWNEADNRIVHVAEASEDRGRVVVHMRSGNPHPIALAAAARLARAFSASIESVFVEDQQLIDLAAHGFLREVSVHGSEPRILSLDVMARELAGEAVAAERFVAAVARTAEVPYRSRVMRDESLRALAVACAECGPWNVIVLADPVGPGDRAAIASMLADVAAATGVILVGRQARRIDGPVVVAIEDVAHLPPMLRAARRLADESREALVALLMASGADAVAENEGLARLVLADDASVRILTVDLAGGASAAAVALRRLNPGLVIARAGGRVLAADGDISPVAGALECPLFVVR